MAEDSDALAAATGYRSLSILTVGSTEVLRCQVCFFLINCIRIECGVSKVEFCHTHISIIEVWPAWFNTDKNTMNSSGWGCAQQSFMNLVCSPPLLLDVLNLQLRPVLYNHTHW